MLLQNDLYAATTATKSPLIDLPEGPTKPIIPEGIELAHWKCSIFIRRTKRIIEVGVKCAEAEDTSTDETLLVDSPLQQDAEYSDYSFLVQQDAEYSDYSFLVQQETVEFHSEVFDDVPVA